MFSREVASVTAMSRSACRANSGVLKYMTCSVRADMRWSQHRRSERSKQRAARWQQLSVVDGGKVRGMDVAMLRTFVTAAETGQFQAAADELGVSQQAVSKRIAALEKHLGVALLVRTSRGSRLSLDGQVFLPHAKKVLAALEQAEHSVRPGSRPLRVDVLNRRIAPAQAVYDFYRAHPGIALDAVAMSDKSAAQAVQAVLDGVIDASFRALPPDQRPPGISADRLLDAP